MPGSGSRTPEADSGSRTSEAGYRLDKVSVRFYNEEKIKMTI